MGRYFFNLRYGTGPGRIAIDLSTHKLYVPEQEEHGHPAARIAIYDAVADPSEQSAH